MSDLTVVGVRVADERLRHERDEEQDAEGDAERVRPEPADHWPSAPTVKAATNPRAITTRYSQNIVRIYPSSSQSYGRSRGLPSAALHPTAVNFHPLGSRDRNADSSLRRSTFALTTKTCARTTAPPS